MGAGAAEADKPEEDFETPEVKKLLAQNKVMAGKCKTPTAANKGKCAALKNFEAAQKSGFSKMKDALTKQEIKKKDAKTMQEIKHMFNFEDQAALENYLKTNPEGQKFWAANEDKYNAYAKSQGKAGFDFGAESAGAAAGATGGMFGGMISSVTGPITAAFAGVSAYLASAIVPYVPGIAPYMSYVTGGLGLVALGGVAYGVKTMFFDGPKGPTKEEIDAAKQQQLAKLQQQKQAELMQKQKEAEKAKAAPATQQQKAETEGDWMLYLGLLLIAIGGCIAASYVWFNQNSDEELVEDQWDIENPKPRAPIPVQRGVHFQSQPGPRKSIRNASKLPSGYNAEQHDRRVEI